ncbi:hypothetical protein PUNSTDRAFT_130865 [Punctularia strigosozonata HHB-11173 SS5]|uniref:uncharacterized protein n=1 Tax=Punctularia strigosozonata (strain HHB-11173) TaxID=741275 RepID=UPI0004416801|nr:uncharacterized protein PUNSTDRAFT_130865 [Punctularia strigosozonata HHB-11173 SS5]EIN12608.1 hypothetical protein PUNSTDRAFT_130865 [Punctularia strigosozonata HHB-11173 SS5]
MAILQQLLPWTIPLFRSLDSLSSSNALPAPFRSGAFIRQNAIFSSASPSGFKVSVTAGSTHSNDAHAGSAECTREQNSRIAREVQRTRQVLAEIKNGLPGPRPAQHTSAPKSAGGHDERAALSGPVMETFPFQLFGPSSELGFQPFRFFRDGTGLTLRSSHCRRVCAIGEVCYACSCIRGETAFKKLHARAVERVFPFSELAHCHHRQLRGLIRTSEEDNVRSRSRVRSMNAQLDRHHAPAAAPREYTLLAPDAGDVSEAYGGKVHCFQCTAPLDPAEARAHVGAHILRCQFGVIGERLQGRARFPNSCRFCGRSGTCTLALMKLAGEVSDLTAGKVETNCPRAHTFSIAWAKKASKSKPSTNVPIACPFCPANPVTKQWPAFWKYNMYSHIRNEHPDHWNFAKEHPTNLSANLAKEHPTNLSANLTDIIFLTADELEFLGIPLPSGKEDELDAICVPPYPLYVASDHSHSEDRI